ncbi:unnamed protein product [Mytilus coruscus]|uniref:ARID domain-containing protein n=1 Tax=Mytilus coruscus TaxID=42192 RepID=A0A6J8BFJ9_MYTCO|nr:unnamed protein product [Mytilus coruscus]
MTSSSSSAASEPLSTNFARIGHVAQQMFPDILQELMTMKEPPHRLSHDINNNWYLSNKLRPDELILINNVATNGYKNFDIPFIYKLVRNLNLLPPPTNGWNHSSVPCPTEITAGDDLERIRRLRNEILHRGNAQVNDSEFSQFFTQFKDIAGRLETYLGKQTGYFVDKFVDLETCCIDEETSKMYIKRFDGLKKSDEDCKKRLNALEEDADALKEKRGPIVEVKIEPPDEFEQIPSLLDENKNLLYVTKTPEADKKKSSRKKDKDGLYQIKKSTKTQLQKELKTSKVKQRVQKSVSVQDVIVRPNFQVSCIASTDLPQTKGTNCRKKCSQKVVVKKETDDLLSEGTLVLAKLDGYDKWPAVMTRDPHTGLQFEMDSNRQLSMYHVEFLGPSHTHAWIKADRVCLYSKDNMNDSQSQSSEKHQKNKVKKKLTSPKNKPSKVVLQKLEKSKKEADCMVNLSREQRLKLCTFRFFQDNHEAEDFQCKDSGFESWNYPASSGSSAISSAENFACSRLQYNTSLVDKSKEERFKLDVEMYKKNEKAFLHDLSRFMKRNNLSVNLTAHWHHIPVGAFQLFLAVHERGGYQEICKKKQWTAVFRELTETQLSAGPAPKNFYLRNIYAYELYVTNGDFEAELKRLLGKRKKKSIGDVMIEDDTGSYTNVDDDADSDGLAAMLADLEEYSSLCQLEEDIEAEKKRMGINIAYHEDSPYSKVSPGVKYVSTPSEFDCPASHGNHKKHQEVPETMFSDSSVDSQNDLVFHQMERIVDEDLL